MSQTVALYKQADVVTVSGPAAADPWKPGQVIQFNGLFDDRTDTGPVLVLVLKRMGTTDKTYAAKGIGCENAYFRSYLDNETEIVLKVMQKASETKKRGKEHDDTTLVCRWRIVAEPTDPPDLSGYKFLNKKGIENAVKNVGFLREYCCSDLDTGPKDCFCL